MASWAALNVAGGDARANLAEQRATEEAQDADNAAVYERALRCQQQRQTTEAKSLYLQLLSGHVHVSARLEYLCNKNVATMEQEAQSFDHALKRHGRGGLVPDGHNRLGDGRAVARAWTLEEGLKVDATYWPLVESLAQVLSQIGDEQEYQRVAQYLRQNDPHCATLKALDGQKKRARPPISTGLEATESEEEKLQHLREIADDGVKKRKLLQQEMNDELKTRMQPRSYELQQPSWTALGKLLLEAFEENNRSEHADVVQTAVEIKVTFDEQEVEKDVESEERDGILEEKDEKVDANKQQTQDNPPPAKRAKHKETAKVLDTSLLTGISDNDTQDSGIYLSEVLELQPRRRKSRRHEERLREEHAAAVRKARELDLAYRLGAFLPDYIDKEDRESTPEVVSIEWLPLLNVELNVVLGWDLFKRIKEWKGKDTDGHKTGGKAKDSKEEPKEDTVQDQFPHSKIPIEEFATTYITQVIEFARRCFEMAARLAEEALEDLQNKIIECNEECGLLLYNVLQEFSLMKELNLALFPRDVYSRLVTKTLAYFRRGLEICEANEEAHEDHFRLLYMIGKTLKKRRWCELRLQDLVDPEALATATEMADYFSKAEAARGEGDKEHALVHAFYSLQALRIDLTISESPSTSALRLVCSHFYEEEEEKDEEEDDESADSAGGDEKNSQETTAKDEVLALLTDAERDDSVRELNVTLARGWLALNIIEALESIPDEDRYFHPSRYVLARIVYWLSTFYSALEQSGYKSDNINALLDALQARRSENNVVGPSDAAARALKEMTPIFDKRRPQIVAIWFSEYIPTAKKFEELNQRQMKYDYYRLKYWRFYIALLRENAAYGRLKEVGSWVLACKEEHDVIDIMLGSVLEARGKVLRSRLQEFLNTAERAASERPMNMMTQTQLPGENRPVDALLKQLAKTYTYYLEVLNAQQRLAHVVDNCGLLLENAELPMVAVFFMGATKYPSEMPLLEKDAMILDRDFNTNVTVIMNALRRDELPPRIYDAQNREAWKAFLDAARSFCEDKWPERSGKGKPSKKHARPKTANAAAPSNVAAVATSPAVPNSKRHGPGARVQVRGKTVGVDALTGCTRARTAAPWTSCWGDQQTRAERINVPEHAIQHIKLLQEHDITPIMVFDGAPLPSKAQENAKRGRLETQGHEATKEKQEDQDPRAVFSACTRAVSTHRRAATDDITFYVAPYEADAQLAFLSRQKIVDVVISQDSDCVPYGVKTVLFKLGPDGWGSELKRRSLGANEELSFVGWTEEMFIQLCVLAGCDYCPSVSGVGIITAYKLVSTYKTPTEVLTALQQQKGSSVPEDYPEHFYSAILTYRHQLVFDPVMRCKLKMLSPLDVSKDILPLVDKGLHFLGNVELRDDVVATIAAGEIHPMTHESYAWKDTAAAALLDEQRTTSKPKTSRTRSSTSSESSGMIIPHRRSREDHSTNTPADSSQEDPVHTRAAISRLRYEKPRPSSRSSWTHLDSVLGSSDHIVNFRSPKVSENFKPLAALHDPPASLGSSSINAQDLKEFESRPVRDHVKRVRNPANRRRDGKGSGFEGEVLCKVEQGRTPSLGISAEVRHNPQQSTMSTA
ncbi:Exonuclease 1 [Phytophthora cactorum]|nr:Exonuclease 1 [Phytophthora cactorum]